MNGVMIDSVISMRGSRAHLRRRSISQPTPIPHTTSLTTIAPNVPAAGPKKKCAGGERDDGEAIEDQRGRVVGETFAFEDCRDALRQLEPPRDRERRDRIGRRYDRA